MGAVIPINKCEALHMCKKYKCNWSPIRLRESSIPIKKKMRILGVTFTKNLLWNAHADNITAKLRKTNNLLKIICTKRKGPHMETGISICRALVEGPIQHCITMYGWTKQTNINKINAAINRCFRTATGILQATRIQDLVIEAKINQFDFI